MIVPREKSLNATLKAVGGGMYKGMLLRWNEVDAHGDRFLRETEVIAHGEPPVFVDHDYRAAPVGKIVHLTQEDEGLFVYMKLNTENLFDKTYLSVGGFAYDYVQNDSGGLDIKQFVVLEASLTATPAQKNTPIMQLKNTKIMAYVQKQEFEQVLAAVAELREQVAAMQEVQNQHSTQIKELLERFATLELMLREVTQQVQLGAQAEVEKVKSFVNTALDEIAKSMKLIAEISKKR